MLTYYYANAFDGRTVHGSDSLLAASESEAREMARQLHERCNAPVTLYNGATNKIVARYGRTR
jgi:hypothetical protein